MGQVIGNPVADTVELCQARRDGKYATHLISTWQEEAQREYVAQATQNVPRHVTFPQERTSLDDTFPSRQSDPFDVPIDFDTKSVISFVAFVPNEPDDEEEEMIQEKTYLQSISERYETENILRPHEEIIINNESTEGGAAQNESNPLSAWLFGLGGSSSLKPVIQDPIPLTKESKNVAWDAEVVESSEPQLTRPKEEPQPIRGFDSSVRVVSDEFRRSSLAYFDDNAPPTYNAYKPQDLKAKHFTTVEVPPPPPVEPAFEPQIPTSEQILPPVPIEEQKEREAEQIAEQSRRNTIRRKSISGTQKRRNSIHSRRKSVMSRRGSMYSAYSTGPRLSTYVALNDDVYHTTYFQDEEVPLAEEHRVVKRSPISRSQPIDQRINQGKSGITETISKWFMDDGNDIKKRDSRPSSYNSSVVDFTVKLKTGTEQKNHITGGVMDELDQNEEYVTFTTPTSRKAYRKSYNSGEYVENLAFA